MARHIFLALLLILWPAVGEARWREASSRHFVIYSEQGEAELRAYAEQLERFDRALRVQLRRPDPERSPATRLTIYVFRNLTQLQSFLGSSGVAGVYFGRHSGSLAFTHHDRPRGRQPQSSGLEARVTLFHEYTHHFLFNNFAFGAPLWFSEGYPEFWSTTDFGEDGSVRFGLVGTHRSVELQELRRIPVRRLVNLRHPIADAETFAAIYGRGWVLSHYLSFEPSRAGQLDAYLRALGEGRSPEEAARAFGDLDRLDRDLEQYLGRSRYRFATLSPDQVRPGPVAIRELGPGEEAIIGVRMRSKRGVDDRQARALVPEARRIAARYPNDPAVQVVLAEVEHDAKNFAEAEAAADRALAADPRMVDAHLFKARALWGRLVAANDRTLERWREVRRWISSANQLDPDDPEPLVAFYETFVASGTQPTRNAVEGLLYAQGLAREDRSLRISAGRQLLILRQAAAARAMLAPLTGDSHSGQLGIRIGELMPALERGDTAAALAQLDAALAEQSRPRPSN